MKMLSWRMRAWWTFHHVLGHCAIGIAPAAKWSWRFHDWSADRFVESEKQDLARHDLPPADLDDGDGCGGADT